ncbi:hypothetical protein MLD38_001953 [Melastoma candidum]|uniref:Uncharacterized protein n=1 Tax=Melastoma candidum TaxID=119954 RepID=A0ACB9SE78_9MYRT|nr:hypothetical protein MLD38_001953 [Melastoma candidum]
MMKVDLHFPAGFRFHPTDEELVSHYLIRKCASQPIPVPIIAEIDLYKFNPWDLPDRALYGEKEWYFFSPRDRKYPNGSRPNRAAGSGYWKATGADKPIGKPKPLGIKKALVFYAGKAPKGDKTNWIMHEYRLADIDRTARKKNSLRLDDWVLCRIYNKKGIVEKRSLQPSQSSAQFLEDVEEKKPQPLPGVSGSLPSAPPALQDDYAHFDLSESIPKLHPESSCSEHTASPEFSREVQSDVKPLSGYWDSLYSYPGSYGGTSQDLRAMPPTDEMSPLQDIFMYLQKPF